MPATGARKQFSDVFWQVSTLYKTDAALEGDFKFAALFGRTWRLFDIARLLDIQDQNAWGYVLNNAAQGGHLETIKAIWSHAGFADAATHDTARGVAMSKTGSCSKYAQHTYDVVPASELGDLFSGSLVKDWLNIALINAARHKHADCVDYLKILGADPAYNQYAAVQYALNNSDADLATCLLADIAFPTESDLCDGLLDSAIYSGDLDCVTLVISRGARFSVEALENSYRYAQQIGHADLQDLIGAAYRAALAAVAGPAAPSSAPKP